MNRHKYVFALLLTGALAFGTWSLRGQESPAPPEGGAELSATATDERDRAEALFAEGSYALALEIYRAIDPAGLAPDEARWVEMRLADAGWRSAAATQSSDTSELDRARQELEALVRDVRRVEDRDRVWVEAEESLGDYWWTRRDHPQWGNAWPHYQLALDAWAGSGEIDLARERYLSIVWRAARPPHAPPYYYYGYHSNQLPLTVLENAREIAVDPQDRAHAAYLIAMTGRQFGGDLAATRRTEKAFEEAIESGRGTAWYDDAIFHYAEWLTTSGRIVRTTDGVQSSPDYVRALELFRQLVTEFEKGETRYHDQATDRIRSITGPRLGVVVSNVFLPGSEIQYSLSYRNVEQVELALYPVNMPRDLRFDSDDGASSWLEQLARTSGTAATRWTWSTNDDGRHRPGQASLTLVESLAPGAYVLEARAGGETARDLVLVTHAALVLKSSGRQALVFVCDAADGSPKGSASVALWVRRYRSDWVWEKLSGTTDESGLLEFDLPDTDSNLELFAAADAAGDQAFSIGQSWRHQTSREPWRIYAFTDRPAYRPEDLVRFKVVARQVRAGGYATPTDRTLRYRVVDPRGTELAKGSLQLNAFGAAWSELALGADLPLGEYRVEFREADDSRVIGGATLFRMEEYKLPEFEVSVETPQDDGRRTTFRVGETVESEVVAEYYFGGPVAGAEVEVVVYQKPVSIAWYPQREFAWFYDETNSGRHYGWGGPGQVIQNITTTTDAGGRAKIRFDTPQTAGQDYEYTIEARVRDASRREVVGQGAVRVTRQRYFAFLRPAHNLYRPGDDVRVELRTTDPNQEPLSATGRIRVTRERWAEVWVDPKGREVSGDALSRHPHRAVEPGFRLVSRGYQEEEILERSVVTQRDDGLAEIEFAAASEGYYRVRFTGDAEADHPVLAETRVWVADRDTRDVGYHHGGLELLVDRDTLQAGGSVPVMISAPAGGGWVLLTVEGEELYMHRLIRMDGPVKLVELEIEERYIPNVFLEAALVQDGQLFLDSRQLIIPPVEQFLDVEIDFDREDYQPGETGRVHVTTRDHEGRPVAAEVAVSLVDASVFYIQQDLSGDIRQFFYGTKRPKTVRTQSTFHQKPYVRLVERPEGVVNDPSITLFEDQDRLDAKAKKSMSQRAVASEVAAAPPSGGRFRAEGMMAADEEMGNAEMAPGGGGSNVVVRSDFRATALWAPHLVTDETGRASAEVDFPDSLTSWRATARVADAKNRFGIAEETRRTRKPLIVRLQAPRFFVVGDELTISAVVNNNTDQVLEVATRIEAVGIETVGESAEPRRPLAAGGEMRIDWPVRVTEPGQAEITVIADAGELDDAMRKSYAVHEHGIDKLIYRGGKARGDELLVSLPLPAERRAGSTTMSVQITPSMAVTMLDALPYLIDYPYGCTEQTMSRFLPSVIVGRTLADLGLDSDIVARRIFGGIEPDSAGRTHPKGARELADLDEMVRAGLARLYDFQHPDGGWGWWKQGESDPYMSAYVVWGLTLAREAGLRVRPEALRRGVDYLDRELVEQEALPDLQAWMLHALAHATRDASPSRFQRAALDNLWASRDRLNAYTRALFALATHEMGQEDRARTLVRNLVNGVKRDRSPDTSVVVRGSQSASQAAIGTAHWGEDRVFWRWSEGAIEATSFGLKALLAIEPDHELVEPVTQWLIRNRRGAQWSNTRDTAFAVLALTDYLEVSEELTRDLEYELFVNDRAIARQSVGALDVLRAPSVFTIDPSLIRDGVNQIRIVRHSGEAEIYFAVKAEFFSLEEPITAAGNEIFVRRQYYRQTLQPTLLKGFLTESRPLDDGGSAISGERVEVVLTVEAKNDYEYLVLEDLKPAGLEAVEIRSGGPLSIRELVSGAATRVESTRESTDYTGRSRQVHQELRDRKVAFFVDKLPQGFWEIRYELRAEIPGTFHALPAVIHAMYVPEIKANGAETRVEVVE